MVCVSFLQTNFQFRFEPRVRKAPAKSWAMIQTALPLFGTLPDMPIPFSGSIVIPPTYTHQFLQIECLPSIGCLSGSSSLPFPAKANAINASWGWEKTSQLRAHHLRLGRAVAQTEIKGNGVILWLIQSLFPPCLSLNCIEALPQPFGLWSLVQSCVLLQPDPSTST